MTNRCKLAITHYTFLGKAYLTGSTELSATYCDIMQHNADAIMGDVLANAIETTVGEGAQEWNLNGEKAMLSVKRV